MSNKKYYTPDSSDICVGFEFELLVDGVWEKHKLRHPEETSDFLIGIYNKKLRVEYLTREHIEGEGFEFEINGKFSSWYKKNIYTIQTIDNGSHGMYIIERCEDGTLCIFRGKCRSINDFRLITKRFLNI